MIRALPGPQSALDPAGIQALRIEHLWWLFFFICLAVYLIVVAVMIVAVVRRRNAPEPAAPDQAPARERALIRMVAGALGVTVVLLLIMLVGDFTTRRALRSLDPADPLEIRVTGHQWWWEFQYQDPVPANLVTTATEIHLPAGRVVKFVLRSADVIHSFWAPNLTGKKDLFPGRLTQLYVRADRPGTYTGQCAEFCGYQHASMRFVVVVETPAQFQRWLQGQRQQAAAPVTADQKRGQAVFLGTTCVMCHSIQGTPAGSHVGPDLTHVASRTWIASGFLPNTPAHLAGWISDPQRIRPGVLMPMNALPPRDLRALLSYLESLR
ncbi:MAG: cytochrome c oxidase subunit II [Bacteroidota bacterium]